MNKSALEPTFYLDYNHPSVQEFTRAHTEGLTDPKEIAIKLFYVVRDKFVYNPYDINLIKDAMKVSEILKRDSAYCIEKAMVLAAALRFLGIPSRLYFGNVRNHIGTGKLEKALGTNVLAFHGCTEVWLDGRWVKATPAFNAGLCKKLGVPPLEFDGENDSIFQQFSDDGRRFMDYVKVHGSYDDLPYDEFVAELQRLYGHIITKANHHYRFDEMAS